MLNFNKINKKIFTGAETSTIPVGLWQKIRRRRVTSHFEGVRKSRVAHEGISIIPNTVGK